MALEAVKKPEVKSLIDGTAEAMDSVLEVVDSYGSAVAELEKADAELNPLRKLVKDLKGELQEAAEEFESDQGVVFVGEAYNVELGVNALSVVAIDKVLLRETLGEDTYNELAMVGVGDIRKYCSPKQLDNIIAEERTGKRRVKVEKNAG